MLRTTSSPVGVEGALLAALAKQDIQLIDTVGLEPRGNTTRRSPDSSGVSPEPPTPQTINLMLDVAHNEDAVVLLEQEGVYSWRFASETKTVPSAPRHRGSATESSQKQVRFQIDIDCGQTRDPGTTKRSVLGDFVFDRVKAFVLKFTARVVVGQAMKFLERNVRKGIVHMQGIDPSGWQTLKSLSALRLPTDRPARILLFIHGTFSSTIGSFGPLGSTPWGEKFLEACWANYDAVIGFDHATLSEDPLANAVELLSHLKSVAWAAPPSPVKVGIFHDFTDSAEISASRSEGRVPVERTGSVRDDLRRML